MPLPIDKRERERVRTGCAAHCCSSSCGSRRESRAWMQKYTWSGGGTEKRVECCSRAKKQSANREHTGSTYKGPWLRVSVNIY